jgi:hypothetical protein
MMIFVSAALLHGIFLSAAVAQQKLAQTGFGFLSVGTDARATGMGEAFATIEGSATALFYNAAGLAGMASFVDLSANHLQWIGDVKYLSGAIALAPFDGQYGVVGISFINVNYGEFKFTQVANNEQGYVDVEGYPKPYAYAIGVGYGKALSNQFSVGGQVKVATQNLGNSVVPVYRQYTDIAGQTRRDTSFVTEKYGVSTLAFDFGTIYKTGFRSLAFGVSVTNFSREIRYVRESFQLPLTFKIGISMNLIDLLPSLSDQHALYVSVDAVHPRSYAEYLNIGGEYVFARTIALRIGYISNHPDYGLTAGVGLQKFGLALDYSYMPHKIFKDIERLSVRFSL